VTDGYLQQLWRKAVLILNGNRCAYCGADARFANVECHHIIKRRHSLTRHDPLNGIPGCMVCHKFFHTKQGEKFIEKHIGEELYARLCELENIPIKQYLVDNGITRKEWDKEQYDKLMEVIKG